MFYFYYPVNVNSNYLPSPSITPNCAGFWAIGRKLWPIKVSRLSSFVGNPPTFGFSQGWKASNEDFGLWESHIFTPSSLLERGGQDTHACEFSIFYQADNFLPHLCGPVYRGRWKWRCECYMRWWKLIGAYTSNQWEDLKAWRRSMGNNPWRS